MPHFYLFRRHSFPPSLSSVARHFTICFPGTCSSVFATLASFISFFCCSEALPSLFPRHLFPPALFHHALPRCVYGVMQSMWARQFFPRSSFVRTPVLYPLCLYVAAHTVFAAMPLLYVFSGTFFLHLILLLQRGTSLSFVGTSSSVFPALFSSFPFPSCPAWMCLGCSLCGPGIFSAYPLLLCLAAFSSMARLYIFSSKLILE